MVLIIKAIDKRNSAKRKFIAPVNGYEAGFFRWFKLQDAKLRDNAEDWPCVYINGTSKKEGTAVVFGFLQHRSNRELGQIVDGILTHSLDYRHAGFPINTRIEYLPPYDKDQW